MGDSGLLKRDLLTADWCSVAERSFEKAAEQADPSNAFESSGHPTQGARQRTHRAEGVSQIDLLYWACCELPFFD